MEQAFLQTVMTTGRQAALAAGAVLRLNFAKPQDITLKGVIDPVTESDLAAQEIIISLIRQTFPDHGFLAEESGVVEGVVGAGFKPAPTLPGRSLLPPPYPWFIGPLAATVNGEIGMGPYTVVIFSQDE